MLIYYMDSEVVGDVSKDNFLANIWEYYRNGYCIMFSRTYFNYMAQLVGGW